MAVSDIERIGIDQAKGCRPVAAEAELRQRAWPQFLECPFFLARRGSAIKRGDEASHTNFLNPAEPAHLVKFTQCFGFKVRV